MKCFFEQHKELHMNEGNNLDFPAHLHEQFEIGYIDEGSTVLILEEKKYDLKAGDFFIVFPNQIHSYEKSENLKSKLIIFSPHLIVEYQSLFTSKIPQSPVISNSENGKNLISLMFGIMTDDMIVFKGFLLSLFGIMTDSVPLKDIDKYNVSTLKKVLIYCAEHFAENITISDVAKNLYISRYHIAHIFREKLNTTFSDYITQKRVEYATTLLCDDSLNIGDIAYQSGFNSLRSFNRNFLKYMGTSPKEYRKTR